MEKPYFEWFSGMFSTVEMVRFAQYRIGTAARLIVNA